MKNIFFALLALVTTTAFADCPHLYPNNTPIVIPGAVELCNAQYVSLYDPLNRAVLLVSELVQPTEHNTVRKNAFHRDNRVPTSPTPGEYEYTGYDRGHMAPADDSTNDVEMHESFAMTNMTPQVPELNRGRWRGVEMRTRDRIERGGIPTHVITAAIYGKQLTMIGNVPVPIGYIKAAYFSTGTEIIFTTNTAVGTIDPITTADASAKMVYAKLP